MPTNDFSRIKSGKLRTPRNTGLSKDLADAASLRVRVKPVTFEHAKRMLLDPTPAEQVLMHRFRRSRLRHFPFRRQEIVLGYILDFYFYTVGICVEVDGFHHQTDPAQIAWDRRRDLALLEHGIQTIRVPNSHALNFTAKTVAQIREHVFKKANLLAASRIKPPLS